ncbi:hypothetical protein Tco_1145930 [Tanacetum coccineum]
MYDSWKSRMELYMQNIEHGRLIAKSVEHGPFIWPMIEENGLTRTKKYEELSATKKFKLIVISRQLISFYKDYQLMSILSLISTELPRIYGKKLPPKWSKFVTDVKLVRDLHTTNFDQLHAYLEQHEL